MSRTVATVKQKRPATPVDEDEEITNEPSSSEIRIKKPKRAETRPCPICSEEIPLRLMRQHAALEAMRVNDICNAVGSTSALPEAEEVYALMTEGTISRVRRAGKSSMATSSSSAITPSTAAMSAATAKEISSIRRRRKKRHTVLRDITRDEDILLSSFSRGRSSRFTSGEIFTCPVCEEPIMGDEDVREAHVDSCLAHQDRLARERERSRAATTAITSDDDESGEVDIDDFVEGPSSVMNDVNLRGSGFHLRNHNEQDVDDEIDIDGDDGFGEAQFTEGDVLDLSTRQQNVASSLGPDDDDDSANEIGDNPRSTMRELLAGTRTQQESSAMDPGAGRNHNVTPNQEDNDTRLLTRMVEGNRIEQLIRSARRNADKSALIIALEAKISHMESSTQSISGGTTILCRICLDPYTEPTTSTGCWHTCCRECWLRCLGVTKLCPICQRITGAHELRRVYL